MRLIKTTALTVGIIIILPFIVATAAAQPPSGFRRISPEEFAPVQIPAGGMDLATPRPDTAAILDYFTVEDRHFPMPPKSQPQPPPKVKTIVATKKPTAGTSAVATTGHSVNGQASWYCKAGVSICHHSYPPGSMVAAACGKLRSAMGGGWRGKTVTVASNGRTITVRLVDWCGSRTKLIDLYWEPMSRLGGKGVLTVKVSW